jgi:predicted DNA-binding transcriptional regulator AlpA
MAARSTSPDNESPRLLARQPPVLQATDLGRLTIHRLNADGLFPTPVSFGRRALAWHWSHLEQWTRSRPGAH